ncbi:ADP-ribosylglycohydrolase family protein [Cellulosimicrobium arenosum]|uniref:ADP-ribosylglycohydrolase family protein n=1 Tax=Cellulosimicrobium arenosum TaxID=2708133 RepID=A0A927J124_9MICO|nr:ADP-ribosylglycohydrolase family protein [Cellulosimicrobium arenosum]MBD8079900.1 ADP-ribosylglycohydrolase family protein [Cellulosimicrobium arenosum]
MTTDLQQDRAVGALTGLAIGDALGMPTQSMSRDQISARYGRITGFVAAAADQPIAPGMAAASITDDTEQALLLARLLVEGAGRLDLQTFAQALVDWERSMIERGSRDLLGPSTKSALVALEHGTDPALTGRYGTTNGAAMRVAPIGIASRPGAGLHGAVERSAQVTHNTGLAISGAAAVATAISAALDGAGTDEALDAAVESAHACESRGHWVAGASVASRFTALRPIARALDDPGLTAFLYEVVGTSVQSQESVVSALLLVDRYRDDPFAGLCTAASLGGDTDTVAAMAGAVLGALHGVHAFPDTAVDAVLRTNHLDLDDLAAQLLALRG